MPSKTRRPSPLAGTLRAYITIEVHDANGRLVRRRRRRARSFVRNFLRSYFGFVSPLLTVGLWAILDTTGASRSRGTGSDQQANISGVKPWIRIGSGTTAPTVTDSELETPIVTAQLTTTVTDLSSGDDVSYSFLMMWTNAGATVTINETTFQVRVTWANVTRTLIISRDLISPGVDIANGEIASVTYTFTTTV
ncbi:hypothetical protein LCGC14_2586390 [marine sediment metagenome]|uniref:Uncharacterized protein n=1 Tax=marine sediment metagenome TaxID=412755 RepID=A0A0F9D5P9_9ZZZZ